MDYGDMYGVPCMNSFLVLLLFCYVKGFFPIKSRLSNIILLKLYCKIRYTSTKQFVKKKMAIHDSFR